MLKIIAGVSSNIYHVELLLNIWKIIVIIQAYIYYYYIPISQILASHMKTIIEISWNRL